MESSRVAENTLWIRERRKNLVELNVGSSLQKLICERAGWLLRWLLKC
jgi:hypothetical protein